METCAAVFEVTLYGRPDVLPWVFLANRTHLVEATFVYLAADLGGVFYFFEHT